MGLALFSVGKKEWFSEQKGNGILERQCMRILGLDYGSKTVGVAVCDPLGITAQVIKVSGPTITSPVVGFLTDFLV